MVLLSVKAGLRACEIASLTWGMVVDARGQIDPILELPANAAKNGSGRRIPLHAELRTALARLRRTERDDRSIVQSERGGSMTAKSGSRISSRNWVGISDLIR